MGGRSRRTMTLGLVPALFGLSMVLGPSSSAGAAKPVRATAPEVPTVALVGTSAGAAAQPTSQGRMIADLHVHDGLVYAGYGDYNANTGPIMIAGIDPDTGVIGTSHLSDTDAVYNLRTVNGHLVAPAIDSRTSADFAIDGPWRDQAPVASSHVFDMVTLDGRDLWMVGSKGADAVAWRSFDGGSTWNEVKRVAPDSQSGYMRFYFAAVVDGRLYLQAVSSDQGPASGSLVFDGSQWSGGPSLLPNGGFGWRPEPFGAGVVLKAWGHGWGGAVYYFDGTATREVGVAYDIEVADSTLYLLGVDETITKTADLTSWDVVGRGPSGGRSLATEGTRIFVGDEASAIWKLDLASPSSDLTSSPSSPITKKVPPGKDQADRPVRGKKSR